MRSVQLTSTPPDHVTIDGKHYPRWAAMNERGMRTTIELLEEIFSNHEVSSTPTL
jgi:hypothetical protein